MASQATMASLVALNRSLGWKRRGRKTHCGNTVRLHTISSWWNSRWFVWNHSNLRSWDRSMKGLELKTPKLTFAWIQRLSSINHRVSTVLGNHNDEQTGGGVRGRGVRHLTFQSDTWATFILFIQAWHLPFRLHTYFVEWIFAILCVCMLICFDCFIALIFCVTLLHCTSILYYVSHCFIALVFNISCSLAWFHWHFLSFCTSNLKPCIMAHIC